MIMSNNMVWYDIVEVSVFGVQISLCFTNWVRSENMTEQLPATSEEFLEMDALQHPELHLPSPAR